MGDVLFPTQENPVAQDEPNAACSESDKRLLAAVLDKELKEAETILSNSDVKLDARNRFGETALHISCRHGYHAVVEKMLTKFPDINGKDYDGWTPLYSASWGGKADIVSLLLSKRGPPPVNKNQNKTGSKLDGTKSGKQLPVTGSQIEIDSADPQGRTPLHIASFWGYTDVVKEIVRYKTTNPNIHDDEKDLDMKDATNRTALYIAAESDYSDVVRALSNADATVLVDSRTALHLASEQGTPETVEAILGLPTGWDALTIRTTDGKDEIPLHLAARQGGASIVEELLKPRPDGFRSSTDVTSGQNGIVLGQKPAKRAPDRWPIADQIRAENSDGNTAMHLAAEEGQADVVKVLLQHSGKDICRDFFNKAGESVLHVAAKKGRLKVVQELLNQKVDVNQATKTDKNTSLHLAAANGHAQVVAALVSKMSPTDVEESKNAASETPLGAAIAAKHWDVARKLLEKIQKADLGTLESDDALFSAAQDSTSHDIVQLLLMKKSEGMKKSLEVQEANGKHSEQNDWGPLHWAAYYGNGVVVRSLLLSTAWTTRQMTTALKACKVGLAELKTVPALDILDKPSEEPSRLVERMQASGKGRDSLLGMGSLGKTRQSAHGMTNPQEREIEERYALPLDMLQDPPFLEASDPQEIYEKPELKDDDLKNSIADFDATVVDFYRDGDRSGLLRRSRKVCQVIFDEGPDKIMENARETLNNLNRETGKEKGFSDKHLQFRWIHLPANNDLTKRIYVERRRPKKNYKEVADFLRRSWFELPEGPSNARFMKPGCKKEAFPLLSHSQNFADVSTQTSDSDAMTSSTGEWLPTTITTPHNEETSQVSFRKLALYMPYFTYADYTPAQACSNQRSSGSDIGSDDGSVLGEDLKKYQRLLETYRDKIIHGSRTLDESYYENLSNMKERNEDQVVTKYFQKHPRHSRESGYAQDGNVWSGRSENGAKEQDKAITILRVDQLWLWVIDHQTIISSSTHRLDHREDPVLEKIFAYLREEKVSSTGRKGKGLPSTVDDMSRFIPKFCIGFFNHCNWKGELDIDKSIYQMFACSINEEANAESELFDNFKTKMTDIVQKIDEKNRREGRKMSEHCTDEATKVQKTIKADDTTSGEELTFKSILKAAIQLQHIKDIRDELNSLKSIVTQQKKAWDDLLSEESNNADARTSANTRSPADYTIANIMEMDKAASRIQESILDVMGLEQNEASINEAVSSRNQAQETIEQGRTLMVFTVITIIFLPLSFLASLFALDITDFPRASPSGKFTPGWVYPKLFGITGGITVIAILIAFSRPLLRFWSTVRKKLPPPLGNASAAAQSSRGAADVPKESRDKRQHNLRTSWRWARETDVEKRAQASYDIVDVDEADDVVKERALLHRMSSSFHNSKAALHELGVKGALKTIRNSTKREA
ncbi:hypothetical protein PV08_09099 [Exophiala spinifera]|uniref:Uncharacterized protein n=1 Tax=Exophiala spinifera TaxID=91928 RepID=A0A0D1YA49_9EURO|nr:uncharacterized protein PV08_09099 [Exophiala spinifera]KIW11826.1 hypothetical protein PV08_09099 [Exophiala spinifera]